MLDFDETYARSVLYQHARRVEKVLLRGLREFKLRLEDLAAVYDGRDNSLVCAPAHDVTIELDLISVKPKHLVGAEDRIVLLALEPQEIQIVPSVVLFHWNERPTIVGRA